MSSSAAASVPGKTILFGEHAAVYGRPALVAALDRRMSVVCRAEPKGRGAIRLEAAAYGLARIYEADEVASIVTRERALDPGDLAVAAAALATSGFTGDLDLQVESAIPPGAGFGSSASLAVGVVSACLRALERPAGHDGIAAFAHRVERLQHGNPSGIDVRAVLEGGALWCRRTADGLVHEAAPLSSTALAAIRLYDTGTPVESTGEMVAAVASLRKRDPGTVDRAIAELERAAEEGREALGTGDVPALVAAVRRAHAGLVALDVVHPEVRSAVAAIEAAGGAAKISGAGGRRGAGSGLLLVVDSQLATPPSWVAHDVALGAPGLREEVAA
ncbi:MAG TPA: mevalonate kinase [Candidatus Polarisedimenticolaceae bacterium]|nr:mevalonate kinase [Candidatus Polarisedimenticolaceae bacterium]